MGVSGFKESIRDHEVKVGHILPKTMHQHQKQQSGCKHVLLRDGDYGVKGVKHTVAWGVHVV